MSNHVITGAKGSWMFTKDGRKLLDLCCGIAVTNTGHCHPKVVKAIQDQATKVFHSQVTGSRRF
jgi:4-aminobutyrate aminotransferase-like enzyme